MAPVQATVKLDVGETVSDSARARELYKYFQPNAPTKADHCFPVGPPASLQSVDDPHRNIPVKSDVTSSKVSSPDTALTAFCQLVAWRTRGQRAMIGLIDADTQYFVAESTKTVDLLDPDLHAPGDDIWMGCSSVTKAGKLCERTVSVGNTPKQGDYPSFIINDLTKDDRFNTLPFVTEDPNLKFYAGVPLITKKGIAIGSLFIVDDQVRQGLTDDEIHFMGTMARTIMVHLEMTREVEERRRGMKMSRGLASFVEGRSELVEADVDTEGGEGSRIAGQFETESDLARTKSKTSHRDSVTSVTGSATSIERKEREYSSSLSRTEEMIRDGDTKESRPELTERTLSHSHSTVTTTARRIWSSYSSEASAETPAEDLSEESSQKRLCSRAANLIRETFEVDGGCIFYDAQIGYAGERPQKQGHPGSLSPSGSPLPEDSHTESQATSGDEFPSSDEINIEITSTPRLSTSEPSASPRVPTFSQSSTTSKKPVELLGFSTPGAASINGDPPPGYQSFRPLQENLLGNFLRRYPRGKLWTFGSEGGVSSSSEDDFFRSTIDQAQRGKYVQRKKAKLAKSKVEAQVLTKHFPGVRQLLFVPLWDAGRTRWLSGCFVWSTELTRILSKQSELSFLTAFGNSVMAEWSRIDTEIADKKKGDFIGSISHELRSPLHGILASAEFLSDEIQSTFEKSMVETISSCGRTLLDTINHILDYSKINHFERTWRKTKREGPKSSGKKLELKQSELPMINLYADVDVSVLCEEVVEGVFAGHIFQSGTAANFDMVKGSTEKMSGKGKDSSAMEPLLGSNVFQQPDVTLIFDVDNHNYQFTTQPGAFRRVVMNLLGNALKYTAFGYVRIKLCTTPMDDFIDQETGEVVPRAMVVLTIADTGKGISPGFLRSKLFTPFAQENSLSSGTGLGLAIVKSIVHILDGSIKIDSEVGRGTTVEVSLPLLRGALNNPDSVSTNTPKSIVSLPKDPQEPITKLCALTRGKRVSLIGFDTDYPDPASQKRAKLLKASITSLLTDWYGLNVVPMGQKAAIIISNEGNPTNISKLIRLAISAHHIAPSVIALSSHTSKFDRTPEPDVKYKIGYVNKPVGPLKLAKAIAQCYEGSRPPTPRPSEGVTHQPDSNDLSNIFEEMSLTPRVEVLDNSRMAADSDNARKVIESPTPNALLDKAAEFPFPTPENPNTKIVETSVQETPVAALDKLTRLGNPTFLLVDDNAINLTLLKTSIGKRKYDVIDQAMDGLAAVKKFHDRQEGYDIIFMDISMPLLDGFGATKEIRAIEEGRKSKMEEGGINFTPALIIAITGLASSDDQARAAKVGVDLFLTKPVSFRDVKKMLDNWEANREK